MTTCFFDIWLNTDCLKGPIRRSSQTRRVASQTCRVKVLPIGVAITRWRQCLIDSFARGMSLVSSDSTCSNRREDKMLFSFYICTWRYNYLQLQLFVQKLTVFRRFNAIVSQLRILAILSYQYKNIAHLIIIFFGKSVIFVALKLSARGQFIFCL